MSQIWSNILSSQYSVEEMRQLACIMDQVEKEHFERRMREGIAIYSCTKYVCHLEDEPTTKEPMENMPLYINDENTVKKAIAIFRLQVGR